MQSQRTLKVAVIGTGGISAAHFKSLETLKRTELVGVCDVAPGRAETVARERGGRPYTDYPQMLDKEKPEAVLLLTPQMVRLEPIQACAERGIPMFIEKPPAKDLPTAWAALAAIRKANLLTSVGFVFRYRKTMDRAKQLLKGRTIHLVRSNYYAPMMLNISAYKPFYFLKEGGGGLVVDQAIHILDLARYVVGDEVTEVQGVGSNLHLAKSKTVTTEENISLNLRFQRGTVGSHVHSWAFHRWLVEFEIVSPEARLLFDLAANTMTGTVDGMKVEYAPGDDAYQEELSQFLCAVATGDRSLVRSTYEDSVKSFAMCIAASDSLESGKPEKVNLNGGRDATVLP